MSRTSRINDLKPGVITRDGEFDATLLLYNVIKAEKAIEIEHGLGREPKKVDIVYNDCITLYEVNSKNSRSVIMTFFANKTNIVLRFE